MDPITCERLWREYADRLLLYATSIVGDTAAAEDALQNVFVRLLAMDAPSSDPCYLFRAVRNECFNALRSMQRSARLREHLFESGVGTGAHEDTPGEVELCLAALPQEQREAVVLKIWAGLSFPDAAEVLGVSEKAVEHRYYRGLAALEERLGRRDD